MTCELTRLQSRAHDLETQAAAAEKAADLARGDLMALGVETELLRVERGKLLDEVTALRVKLENHERAGESDSIKTPDSVTEVQDAITETRRTLAAANLQLSEKEGLLRSLRCDLEQREQYAARLERELKQVKQHVDSHEADIGAWEMELKFRNSRITQLEAEVARLQGRRASQPPR